MDTSASSVLVESFRILGGAVFVVAGIAKIQDRAQFRSFLSAQLSSIPPPLLSFSAVSLPILEVSLGLAIWYDRWRLISSAISIIAMVLFIAWGLLKQLRGSALPCSCFGALVPQQSNTASLVRNLLLLFGFLALASSQ